MNQTEKENGKEFIIAAAVFIAAAICQMFSMIKSGFLGTYNAEVSISLFALLTFIYVVFRIFRTASAVYTASFISILLFANWAQLMLHYTCHSDITDDILKKVINFMLYVAFSIVATFAVFMILNKIKQFRNLCLVLFSVVAVGMSMFIILFSGTDSSNTSTTTSGVQPAILMMFLMLYAFSGAIAGNNGLITKIIYFCLFWGMLGSLALKHEFGVPFMTLVACVITYFFFNKSKEIWFIIANIILPIAGIIVIMIAKPALREDTMRKIITRFSENDQWKFAKMNIQTSSLFGSEKYDIYLPASSSDYAMNVDCHYWGYIWMSVMILSFFIMSINVYKDIMRNSNDNIISNIRKLAYSAIFINVIYNILDNVCGAPIIGVQMLGCGISGSIALLTGLLFGSVIADPQKMKASILVFLEKYGIITAKA